MKFKEYKQLGDELSKQERWQEAATAYQEALKLGKKNANVYYLLAQVQQKQGDFDAAMGNYRQACNLNPEVFRFHKSLGDILAKKEDFAGAINAYQQAIKLEPKNTNIRNLLAKVEKQKKHSSTREVEKSVVLNSKVSQENKFKEYKQLGDELSKQESLQEAATAYLKAIKLSPKNAELYYLLAQIQEKRGNLQGAIENYQQAVDLDQNVAQYKESLAKVRAKKLLLSSTRPLFSKEHKLSLFWSAKAGCTFATKWFFFQIGQLEEALSYDPWIHNFTGQLFRNQTYKDNLIEILGSEINIIKVVRNPYSRAVSSYIHIARYGYEFREANEKLSEFFGRNITREQSFSFREFVNYLETIDLSVCDAHHSLQIHPSEEQGLIKPNFIIKLENSFSEIREIEKKLKLKKAPLEEFSQSEHHTNRDSRKNESLKGLCADFPFEKFKDAGLPTNLNVYDDSLREKVANLYKIDFETYNYDINSIPEK